MTFNYAVTPDTSAIQTDTDAVTLDSQGFEINVNFLDPYDVTIKDTWVAEAGAYGTES